MISLEVEFLTVCPIILHLKRIKKVFFLSWDRFFWTQMYTQLRDRKYPASGYFHFALKGFKTGFKTTPFMLSFIESHFKTACYFLPIFNPKRCEGKEERAKMTLLSVFPLHLDCRSNPDSQRSQKLTNKLSWLFKAYTWNKLYFSPK